MAICGNCGSESARVRSSWTDKGVQLKDACPKCDPGSFEKIKSVRDGQITMGHEYMPQMYRKVGDEYVAKDELLADTEAQILDSMENSEANVAYRAAVEKKRQNRRTTPLSAAEIQQAINRVNEMAQA